MAEDFIPDDKFVPDPTPNPQSPQAITQAAATATPQSSVAAPSFIPDESFESDEDKYSAPKEQYRAMIEGAGRGLTFGLSDLAEAKLGKYLPESMAKHMTPEAIKARMEANPVTAFSSNILGGGAALGLTGGVPAMAAKTAVGRAAASMLSTAAEGGAFGAGNAVSDYALGDPDLNAQKVMSEIGFGAASALGLKALGAVAGHTISGAKTLASAIKGKAAPLAEDAIANSVSEAPGLGEKPPVVDVQEGKMGVQPTSYDEIAQRVKDAQYKGYTTDLPQKPVLEDALSRVALDAPVHPLQLESLTSQQGRDAYKAMLELPGKEGDVLRNYEAIQKRELTDKIDSGINDLSPEKKPTSDAVEGGKNAIEAFTSQYQKEKAELGPIFQKLKETPLETKGDALTNILDKMTKEVPGVANMFEVGEDGALQAVPYKTSWGISKTAYNATKEAIEALKESPSNFEALQNIRNGLDQHINPLEQGKGPSEIRSLKKGMMDYMQDSVQTTHPDVEVRNAFKRYAINEQERGAIEKTFGASVGNPDFALVSKVKPELIGDKIFSNTANVSAAKQILETKDFNHILANWISEARASATTDGKFSSAKFGTFLKKNQDALNVAFQDNPKALQNLKDLATISRILPDSVSINPSGTAKTLAAYLGNAHGPSDLAFGIAKYLKDKTIGNIQDQVKMNNLNQALAGRAQEANTIKAIGEVIKKQSEKIATQAKSIMTSDFARGAATSAVTQDPDHYEKNVKKVKKLTGDHGAMLDHISNVTDHLYAAAPNITQSLNTSMATAASFLESKIPAPGNMLPFSTRKWEPTTAQKIKFNSYYAAVEDPVAVMKDIKHGFLSNESMEALQAVHPKLLGEMQQKVLESLYEKKPQNLPFGVKVAISKFLGKPMTNALIPQVMAANQGTFAVKAQQQGGGKSTVGGLKELGQSKRAQTGTQGANDEA